MTGFGHCGCDHQKGLGAIDHNGFVVLGAMSPAPSTGGDVYRDLAVGIAAFAAPIVYNKMAPKKWPHTKKLWQDLVVVAGAYFVGSYAVRRVFV